MRGAVSWRRVDELGKAWIAYLVVVLCAKGDLRKRQERQQDRLEEPHGCVCPRGPLASLSTFFFPLPFSPSRFQLKPVVVSPRKGCGTD